MTAPTKAERKVCWDARDDFWNCLDKNNDDASKCKEQRNKFESSCSQTWLKYFDRRREYLKFQSRIESGFDPVSDDSKNSDDNKT